MLNVYTLPNNFKAQKFRIKRNKYLQSRFRNHILFKISLKEKETFLNKNNQTFAYVLFQNTPSSPMRFHMLFKNSPNSMLLAYFIDDPFKMFDAELNT